MTNSPNERRVFNFELAPFEVQKLPLDDVNIGLAACDAPEVYIRGDSETTRLCIAASLPIHSVYRYLINPYAHAIKGTLIGGHETKIVGRQQASHWGQFELATVSFCTTKTLIEGATDGAAKKRGMFLLPKQSSYHLKLQTPLNHNVMIVPNSRLEYKDTLPTTMLGNELISYHQNGKINTDIVGVTGVYSNFTMGQWIESLAYESTPVLRTNDTGSHTLTIAPDLAVFVYAENENNFEVNASMVDIGQGY